MAWPVPSFGSLSPPWAMSLLDQMFTQIAQMIPIACTASGSANAIVLNPNTSNPPLAAYGNFNLFTFSAIGNSTGVVTVQFISLTALPLYLADGVTQVTNQIVNGHTYRVMFIQALNAGAGGFILLGPTGQQSAIEFVIDGGGSALTTGIKGYLEIPFAASIQRSTLLADQSGFVVVDIFKCTYAQFDASATHPVAADKITASAPPTISSATKSQDTTLAGWTTIIGGGDILAWNINSVTSITRVTSSLQITKS